MANADDQTRAESSQRLAAAIAARDPETFLEALESVDAATRDVALSRLPESLRMVRVLFYLQMYMDPDMGGVEGFLLHYPEDVGAYAADADRWCRSIGAKRAAEYLARSIALFPGGKVPTDYGERVTAAGEGDADAEAFEELDREYADARPELATRLRAYLKLHQRELEAAIAEARGTAEETWALPAVLEIEDSVSFLEGLHKMVERDGAVVYAELDETSPDVVVVRILLALCLTVGADGIWKFLAEQETGAYLPQAERWCRVIGASRAAEYLAAVAALFPGSRVPSDDDERNDAMEQIEDEWQRKRIAKPGDPALRYSPFTVLDQRYEGATTDLTDALRAYLRANATNVKQARDALGRIAAG